MTSMVRCERAAKVLVVKLGVVLITLSLELSMPFV